MFIAPNGQTFTQSPQPTHILAERSIGSSKGSSWISSLCVQVCDAGQMPNLESHSDG